MKNKKLLGILGITALLLAGNFAWQNAKEVDADEKEKILYLTPSGEWRADGARFAAYFWDTAEATWHDMTDADEDGIYEVTVPDACSKVIFCRMNGGTATNDWNTKWDQTEDLTIPNYDGANYIVEGWSAGDWSQLPNYEVKDLFSRYYGENGQYVKATSIKIKNETSQEIKAQFHGNVNKLERITYYNDDALWMENGSGYSYYGTDGSNMTNGKVDGLDKHASGVAYKGKTMEQYYVTLHDFSELTNNSIYVENPTDLSNGWTKNGNVFENSTSEVLDAFRLFTAPLWLNSSAINKNYITYTKATVEEDGETLIMKLYASGTNDGAIKGSDENTETDEVFSVAYIEKGQVHTYHVGNYVKVDENKCIQNCIFCDDTVEEEHTGGQANCKDPANCEKCGTAYGETASHVGGTATCLSPAICSACGTPYGEKSDKHTHGDATFTAPGKCTVCKVEITEQILDTLYLKPNSNWTSEGARFAAYFFNSTGNTWASMTYNSNKKLYEVEIPAGDWTNVIFCRMNPGTSANNWNNKWNQTGDLTLNKNSSDNTFTVPNGAWNDSITGWSHTHP